jgi:hypothetical protein
MEVEHVFYVDKDCVLFVDKNVVNDVVLLDIL